LSAPLLKSFSSNGSAGTQINNIFIQHLGDSTLTTSWRRMAKEANRAVIMIIRIS
jgi:hypothetical protein